MLVNVAKTITLLNYFFALNGVYLVNFYKFFFFFLVWGFFLFELEGFLDDLMDLVLFALDFQSLMII